MCHFLGHPVCAQARDGVLQKVLQYYCNTDLEKCIAVSIAILLTPSIAIAIAILLPVLLTTLLTAFVVVSKYTSELLSVDVVTVYRSPCRKLGELLYLL